MLVLTVVSGCQLFLCIVHHAHGFGGQTLTIRNAFVRRNNLILRSKNDETFHDHDDNDGVVAPKDQVSTQDRDSLWLVGSDVTMEELTSNRAKNILPQQFQPTTTILSSSSPFGVSRRMEEIEAMGGDPFFLDTDADSDETLGLEPQVEEISNENLELGLLLDLTLTSSGVVSRMDSQQTSGPKQTRDTTKMMVVPSQEWGDRDDGVHKEVARKEAQEIDEILAMGGDPFFLVDDDDDPTNQERDAITDKARSMKKGLAFRIEKKYESDETDRKELSPMDILSQLSSFSVAPDECSGMNILQRLGSTTNPKVEDEWTMIDDSNLLDEIEAMGGDPFFLDVPAQSKATRYKTSKKMNILQGQGSISSLDGDDKPSLDDGASWLDDIEAMGGDSSFLDVPGPSIFARDDASKTMSELQQLGTISSLGGDDELDINEDVNILDEVEVMGGDPFFLDLPNPSNLVRDEVFKTMSIQQQLGSITSLDGDEELAMDNDANLFDEIEAMGGDPFFLDMPNPSRLARDKPSSTMSIPQRLGSIRRLDGGFKVAIDNDPSFPDVPDASLLVQSEVSETITMLERLGRTKILDQEDKFLLSDDANLLDEIEAMGGDPSFLDVPNQWLPPLDSLLVSQQVMNDGQVIPDKEADGFTIEETDWEWDGLVDDDAHMDII